MKTSIGFGAVTFCLFLSSAVHANEVIVDGKPCNDFCQSWIGVHQPAAPEAGNSPPAKLAVSVPRLAVPRVVRNEPASDGVHVRTAVQPRAVPPLASRDEDSDGASTVLALPRTRISNPAVAAGRPRPSKIAVQPRAVPPLAAKDEDSDGASTVLAGPRTRTLNPTVATGRPRPSKPARDDDFANGPITLPRLSELVAVRGAIIVETPTDRALREKQLAQLMKETTRPKQTRIGLSGSTPEQSNASILNSRN